MQVRNEVSPICDQPSMNGHTQSGIYDLEQTSTGEIITKTIIISDNQYFKKLQYCCKTEPNLSFLAHGIKQYISNSISDSRLMLSKIWYDRCLTSMEA